MQVDDDAEFIMATTPFRRKAEKRSRAAPVPSSPPRAAAISVPSVADFLSGFAPSSRASALPGASTSSSLRRDRPTVLFDRVQDRLALKRFTKAQRRAAEGPPLSDAEEDDESRPHPALDVADVTGKDEQDDEESDSAPEDGVEEEGDGELSDAEGDEERATASSSSAANVRPGRSVRVVEWEGSVAALRGVTDFSALALSRPLVRAIAELGWTRPTAVQSAVVPHAVAGRDVLANAATGSGKTAAFMLPILERLLFRPNRRVPLSRVLVLLPTRELAAQCLAMTEALARYTDVRCALVVGGTSMASQEAALRLRPDIVLATPGRLIDHLRNTATVHLEDVEVLVLDEADRLLELGFQDELREIVKLCPRQRQTLLFSATLSPSVHDLILLSCKDPIRIAIDPFDAVVAQLSQEFVRVRQGQGVGAEAQEQKEREAVLLALCARSFRERVLLFTRTKEECHRLALLLSFHQIKAAELQGGLTQPQRQEALELFRDGKVTHLVCTDLASRGLDLPGVLTVIQSSMPAQLRLYIHRVGRTARAGRRGRAVTLVGFHERKALKALMKRSTDAVHARVVPADVVAHYRQSVARVEEDVAAVLAQERVDKAERVAEMEVNKARNTLLHEREILSRPPRTWFQNAQEKLSSKAAGVQLFPKPSEATAGREADGDGSAQGHGDVEDDESDDGAARERDRRARAKKADPLRGLSRAQKRRRLMRMEAERAAAQRLREARAADPTVSADDIRVADPLDAAIQGAKAAKRAQLRKEQSRAQTDAGTPIPAGDREPRKRRRVVEDGVDGASPAKRPARLIDAAPLDGRYRVRRREARAATAAAPTRHKPKAAKGRKAFKSKGKHRRR